MIRLIRITWFQLKIYSKNQYFIWLMLSSSISMFLILYIVGFANHSLPDSTIWIRSGIFGLWASVTSAAGIISFQQYQGTLQYLLNEKMDTRLVLISVVLPAALFGLLSFLVTLVMALILNTGIEVKIVTTIFGIIALWMGATIMSILIATLFVLSTDAIIYEQIINIPIVLLSGVFGFSKQLSWIGKISEWIFPITSPVKILNTQLIETSSVVSFIVSVLIWSTLIYLFANKIIMTSKSSGRLGAL